MRFQIFKLKLMDTHAYLKGTFVYVSPFCHFIQKKAQIQHAHTEKILVFPGKTKLFSSSGLEFYSSNIRTLIIYTTIRVLLGLSILEVRCFILWKKNKINNASIGVLPLSVDAVP